MTDKISIHALVKRATTVKSVAFSSDIISIHALVKRATPYTFPSYLFFLYFNPRPREEGDKVVISTSSCALNFNPRPREEGDQVSLAIKVYGKYFNPRPREEGDSKFIQ